MNKKEFKTLDEQLGIFKSKGLTINDEEEARNILFYKWLQKSINGFIKRKEICKRCNL